MPGHPAFDLDEREAAAVIAGLRLLQRIGVPVELEDVATNGGAFDVLDDTAIDALCERINLDLTTTPPPVLIESREEPVRVEDLKGGMMCDLEGDMFADNAGRYPEFEFAYAVVVEVQVNPKGEPPGTVIVEFDKITVAFPIGHTLPTIKDPQ
ncbi:hypothetical protein CcrC1_gp532 [Caulobacter phage C1]|nr:hypothetical protein CcrC1_gp039 [Caulobacter phage C1]UTU08266.1 hypothetical protein CcrC2_gp038 [Caulobacter phage C2]UTU08789.1 hypothetical protein CcrJ4_gp038 [Caulobacter phage J4]UTU09327.1 hypothetical protein CcrBL47_gp041 [Caulobacter phage BL47]UTU09901.1 hypothetical protein CcrRB23_gp039 [Caulobacter phage RB23]WGN96926.1 hypothetical protein [Bertelyvirus sp.]